MSRGKRVFHLLCILLPAVSVQAQTDTLVTEDITHLREVVVTGTRTPKLVKDSPVLTRVITAKDIRKLNPATFRSLLEMELPGIEFTSNANVPNINLQGLDGNYVLFLVDGERIAGETRNNIDYDLLNPNNIERVEIVKGSLSTLYGSNAMGGVINIITKKNTRPLHLGLNARAGSFGEQQYALNAGLNRGQLNSQTSALWKTIRNYTLEDREYLTRIYPDKVIADPVLRKKEVEGGKSLNLEQKLAYRFSDLLSSEVKGTYLQRERFNAGAEGTVLHNLYYSYNALLRNSLRLDERNHLDLSYNFSRYDKVNFYHRIDLKEKDYTHHLHNLRLISHNRLTSRQMLTSGAEFLSETLSTYMFQSGEKFSADSYTLYTQHDFTPAERLNLLTGVRWDKHSNYGGNLSPSVSLKYTLSRAVTLRTTYAGGFRSPSLKELHTNWDHLGMFQIIGNPHLKPEKSRTFSLSGDYSRGKMYVSASLFRNLIHDKLNLLWNAANDTIYYQNTGRQILKGAELNTAFSPLKNWKVQMGYTYTHDGRREDGRNLSYTRPHTAVFKTDYTFGKTGHRTVISLNGKYLSSTDVYSEDNEGAYYKIHYPGYSTWRLQVSRHYKDYLALSAGLNNIFNYTPAVNSFYSSGSAGRTFFISLNLDSGLIFSN
ncbi:MAG: TonB-dependent receptor [Leadbetterella sp.]|nr:TonB-dependent receptor [Leadbetterella sp.]